MAVGLGALSVAASAAPAPVRGDVAMDDNSSDPLRARPHRPVGGNVYVGPPAHRPDERFPQLKEQGKPSWVERLDHPG